MYLLTLYLSQSSSRNTHNLILGVLTDLCENPKTVPHLLAWKGRGERTAASLLVDVWKQEETHMGVRRDLRGVLSGEQGYNFEPHTRRSKRGRGSLW